MSTTKPYSMVQVSSEAPDLLLKKISELQKILYLAMEKPGSKEESIKFYKDLLSVMKYSWDHMMLLNWVHRRNTHLENENAFLKDWAGKLQEELNRYRIIQEMKLEGNFDDIVNAVDEYILKDTTNQ